MEVVIGVQLAEGEYQGRQYKNVNFSTAETFEKGKGYGQKAKITKVKYSVLSQILGNEPTLQQLSELVNKSVEIYFDEFGIVKFMQFFDAKK